MFLLLFAVLSGCGEYQVVTTGNPITSQVLNSPDNKLVNDQLDPYKVKWYMAGNKHYPDTDLVEEELAKKLYSINSTVDIQVFAWSEYPNNMSMIIASGEQFDICFMGTWTNYFPNVASGAFVDLTDLVEEKLPNLYAKMDSVLLEGSKVKGRLYGLPTIKETYEAYGLDVDKEFAEQIGADFSNVKTYADLTPILAMAKEKLPPDVYPMVCTTHSFLRDGAFDNLGDITIPGVVRLDDASMRVINQFESSELIENWKLMRSWYEAGYINKNGAVSGAPDYWNQRKGLCRPENMGPVNEYAGAKNNTIQRVFIGNKIVSTGSAAGSLMCFSKSSRDIDRALLFYDTVNADPDLYNLLASGIEGRHYRVIDRTTDPIRVDFIKGQNENTVGYVHSGGAWSLGGDWFNSYLSKLDPPDRNRVVRENNETAVVSRLLGFSFDPVPVKSEIAACANVYSELGIPLNCGAIDPDTNIPKFIEKLKAAGAGKIIAEKQRQLGEWRTENRK